MKIIDVDVLGKGRWRIMHNSWTRSILGYTNVLQEVSLRRARWINNGDNPLLQNCSPRKA